MKIHVVLTALVLILGVTAPALAASDRAVGEVKTAFQMVGPDHKIKVAAFEDPKVDGVTCFVSRAVTGGLKGAFGVAEDPSEASVACQQTGPVVYKAAISTDKNGEEVFDERRSFLFKTLHVTRMFDAPTKTLVYLTWSDRLLNGSAKNSVSAVTPMPWGTVAPGEPKLSR